MHGREDYTGRAGREGWDTAFDFGVPVEEKLVTEREDGSRDYSEFYDLDRIRDCMNESN